MNGYNKINLSKLKKCDQVWDNMLPREGGRLCEKCNKHIIDFTKLSNEDIANAHIRSEEPVCGFYTKEQLTMPKAAEPQLNQKGIKPAFLGLLAMLSTNTLDAQTQEPKAKTEQLETEPKTDHNQSIQKVTIQNASKHIITGIVVQKSENKTPDEPLPFAFIYVKGNDSIRTHTDFEGRYALDVSSLEDTTNRVTIVFATVGFKKIEKTVSLKTEQTVDFILTEDDAHTVTAFYVEVDRPSFIKRTTNKMTIWMDREKH